MSHDPPVNPPSEASAPDAPRPEHSAPPVVPIRTVGPRRRLLSWVLSAASVLGLLLVMLLVILPRLSQAPHPARNPPLTPDPAAALPPADPAAPAPPPAAKTTGDGSVPLSVTLYSAGSGKHVPVGKPVQISAYAALPPGGSATIAISCTRSGGPPSLLALAQGSLSTAYWTPAAPGRYDFAASALDSRKISAFSRHVVIVADAPPAPAKPLPPAAPPVKVVASVRAPHAEQSAPPRITARPSPARPSIIPRPAPKRFPAKPAAPPAPQSKAYHVAAAQFVVRPVAETLAGALRRRGLHAFVRVTTRPHHKPTYTVETGKFLRPADAQKQLGVLKQDGYPAFVSR